jgi:predicted amidophosphoribosyltransferase
MYEPVRHVQHRWDPVVHCPDCYAWVALTATFCWRCERIFDGEMLHEMFDKEEADAGDQQA